MNKGLFIEPTWKRLGFSDIPDLDRSGKDVGIVILDMIRPHSKIRHLNKRLKYIIVNDDFSITSREPALEKPEDFSTSYGEHGLMSLLLLSHLPFEYNGQVHTGIAPAANFIVLNHGAFREGEEERLKKGINWILQRKSEWNIKLILCTGWNVLEPGGWIENTANKPVVKGLRAAVEAGLLVVASNGNTRFLNELPPVEYFAVGGYLDRGASDFSSHEPFPDEPWGRNGDGHVRPDILAPRLYLPVPYCEKEVSSSTVSFFAGTSGASALVAGVCAHILSLYPGLNVQSLRDEMIRCGLPIEGYDNKAPRVFADNIIKSATQNSKIAKRKIYPPVIKIKSPLASLMSADPVERGLALTMLVRKGQYPRNKIWEHVTDPSPIVRKVAVWALQKPYTFDERMLFWEYLYAEEESGVRGHWLYGLLHDAYKGELDLWMPWITDVNWSVRWCVSEYLKKYAEFPKLETTHDPNLVKEKALPVLKWYNRSLLQHLWF